jgi:hypothetical protein
MQEERSAFGQRVAELGELGVIEFEFVNEVTVRGRLFDRQTEQDGVLPEREPFS